MHIHNDERILLLAPTATDAALSRSILSEAKLACMACKDLHELSGEISSGTGAILLTEEVLSSADVQFLIDALQRQPVWSDIPIVMLSTSNASVKPEAWATELLGNVTVLERPVRVTTLVSALHMAVRERRRQYQLRQQLIELKQVESSLRQQSERQRLLWEAASVLLTTEEPVAMMQELFSKIAPHLDLDAYFNFMVDESGEALQLVSCSGIDDDEARKISRLDFGQAICGNAALSRQPIAATHIQQSDDPKVQLVKKYGIRCYACHPLMAEGRLLGTLSFASRRRDEFGKEELEFLRTICHYVAVAYERVNLIRQLRDIDRRKDEFLATLAHELRNPLAPIQNALEILRLTDNGASAQVRQMMDRQLGQMVHLIDDLLDVSRITRGKLALRREYVTLTSIVDSALDTVRPLIDTLGHRLTVDLPPQPVYLDADSMRLAQVFANLLNNAAKYTERGGQITLTASLSGNTLRVAVHDTGIGIAPEVLPAIFEMFTQGDRSLEKSQGGLGIGLTLVRRLVEMHGGSVEARSDGLSFGSEFIVRLPIAKPPQANDPAPADIAPAESINCRILVADDNQDAAESMGEMLRLLGHDVRTVHNGIQALEGAEAFRPDIALLDIGMPRMNGYDVARNIRAQSWGAQMVLIALTGLGQEEDKRQALQAGFDRHFTKPVKLSDLERLVSSLHDSPVVAH
jgi:signal transduction histidine kinase/ActR/RegA family two-component response regulator